jgi:hypothetical protein
MLICGGSHPQAHIPPDQLTKPSFRVPLTLSQLKGCGRLGLLVNAIFFAWLVEHNRCWTSDRLARRGMDHPERCPLCGQHDETINHLLVSCVFTRQVWAGLFREVGLQELVPQQVGLFREVGLQELVPQQTEEVFEAWWHLSSQRVQGEFRRGFNSLVILGSWITWKHRNKCVFYGSAL